MKRNVFSSVLTVLAGACLAGLLWRLRGSHGWGSSWGVLAFGFVFLLFLASVPGRKGSISFPLLSLAAFSFMLTTPSWGTFLAALDGTQTLDAKGSDVIAEVGVHPLSAVLLLVCLGFGLSPLFGVLTGKAFGGKAWKWQHFLFLALVYYGVTIAAQTTIAHPIVRALQPECVRTFADALQTNGIQHGVYRSYLAHFASINWAKKLLGGRHYFASVQAVSRAFGAAGALLFTRCFLRDKSAARTGAVLCGAFACAITVSDLFFYFGDCGLLPDRVAPWSMWEYCTGFLFGGIATAYLLQKPTTPEVRLPLRLSPKAQYAVGYVLFAAAAAINIVRPALVRMDESRFLVPAGIAAGLLAACAALILRKQQSGSLDRIRPESFARAMTIFFAGYFALLYLCAGDSELRNLAMLHNALVLSSLLVVLLWCLTAGCASNARE